LSDLSVTVKTEGGWTDMGQYYDAIKEQLQLYNIFVVLKHTQTASPLASEMLISSKCTNPY